MNLLGAKRMVAFSIFAILSLMFAYLAKEQWEKMRKVESEFSGVLLPENKKSPDFPERRRLVPKNALSLFLGNSVSYVSQFPHTVVKVGDESVLVVNKKNNGITISAKFCSRDNKIVAELKENKFYINQNNYFRIERPNKSALIVFDQEGNQVLNVDYLNKTAIKLLGIIFLKNRRPIIIAEDTQDLGAGKFSNCSFYNSDNSPEIILR